MSSMQLRFIGDMTDLNVGIDIFSAEVGFRRVSTGGLPVHVWKEAGSPIHVSSMDGIASITYSEKIHFYRALGLLVEALRERQICEITEEPQFRTNGAMFDVSQGNAVITVPNIEKVLLRMALGSFFGHERGRGHVARRVRRGLCIH